MTTPTKTPKPFQKTDSDLMSSIGNCIHNGEPGIGKSCIGISLISGRTLVIMPKKALFQYADEIEAFRPELTPTVIFGTPGQRKKAYLENKGLILLTYDQLRIDAGIIAGLPAFQTIIFDEIHKLCSTTTKTHKNLRKLLAYYKQQGFPRPRMYGTTATILMNSPMDIFGIFNILRPELFPNYLYFVNEYMYKHPTFGYILGARTSKLSKLGEIIKPYIIHRTLQEVCPQMPPHIDETIRYELSPKESKLYSDIRAELLLLIDPQHIDLVKNPISLQNALTKLQKLSELTDSADLIGHSGIPSTKLELLKDKVDEVLKDNTRKLIVYSWFARRLLPQLLPLMADYNPVYIVGGMDAEENRKRFKTDPACRVLILSTAGSEALSFEEASYLIRLDTPFSIGRNVQLSGRIRRQTTVEPTFSYTLAAAHTVDDHMLKILDKKKLINNSVFGLEDLQELLS